MDKIKQMYDTAQAAFQSEFLEDDEKSSNETLDLLHFMQHNSTHLSKKQMQAIVMLNEFELPDLAQLTLNFKYLATPQQTYMSTIEKLTMADRIKGNAKLSHLVKSDGLGNPAQNLKAQDLQAQGMSRREIDRY